MAHYHLTSKAESEIESIYEYSIVNFGVSVAKDYISGLISGLAKCFELLANNQSFGNDYSFILDGLLRYEYRSHAIYYQRNQHDILIIRVLGSNQDPARNIQ